MNLTKKIDNTIDKFDDPEKGTSFAAKVIAFVLMAIIIACGAVSNKANANSAIPPPAVYNCDDRCNGPSSQAVNSTYVNAVNWLISTADRVAGKRVQGWLEIMCAGHKCPDHVMQQAYALQDQWRSEEIAEMLATGVVVYTPVGSGVLQAYYGFRIIESPSVPVGAAMTCGHYWAMPPGGCAEFYPSATPKPKK